MVGPWKAAYTAEEVEAVPCPLCQAATSVQLGQEWSLGIVQCTECDLVYITPRLREPDPARTWSSDKAMWGMNFSLSFGCSFGGAGGL